MNARIRLKSRLDDGGVFEEEYSGSYEVKGRYIRFEYKDGGGYTTHMTLCLEDSGMYKLFSDGERKLSISTVGGVGSAELTLGAHTLEGKIWELEAKAVPTLSGYKASVCYTLAFSEDMKNHTTLTIEAKNE